MSASAVPPAPLAIKPAIREVVALTAIRGLAAWWIVLYHFRDALPPGTPVSLATFFAHGDLAVDLFFELSGFVIALNYAKRFRHLTLRETRAFLGLRLARIYPLHVIMLAVFLLNPLAITLFSHQQDLGYRYNPIYYLLSLLLMQNWGFTNDLAWNIPAWSISTEWFAYLVFPLLAWFATRLAGRPISAALTSLITLAALAAIAAKLGFGLGDDIPHFGLLRCVLEFAAGMGLQSMASSRRPVTATEANVATLGALICFIAYGRFDVPDIFIIPAGFLLLIHGLSHDTGLAARLLKNRVALFFGTISYSTYLVHYFVKDWVKFVLVNNAPASGLPLTVFILVTAALSVVLYYGVEVPGRRALREWVFATDKRQKA